MVCDNLKGKRVGPGAFLWACLDQHNLCANNWIMYKLLQSLHMENLSSWFSSFIIHIAHWAWAREDFWTYVVMYVRHNQKLEAVMVGRGKKKS